MELERVVDACREAGDAARALHGSEPTTKADGSPVTQADLRANEILMARLSADGLPIVSEEAGTIPPHAKGKAWIVDPLDGTSSFIKNDPHWAVMVALVEDGVPILGVVYAPDLGIIWSAQKGAGAFVDRDGTHTQIAVSRTALSQGASILLSQNHFSEAASAVAKQLQASVRQTSGTGIKACLVAEGAADMYWSEAQLGEWDACAPHIILQEAGGTFTDARGRAIVYGSLQERPVSGIAASNSLLHHELAEAGKAALGE